MQPAGHIRGATGGELLGEWWGKVAERPRGQNPFEGPGERCLTLGRDGGVLGPVTGPTTCTVKAGMPVLRIRFTSECSDIEEPPSFAVGEAAQQACAEETDQGRAGAMLVTIDGGTPVGVHSRPLRASLSAGDGPAAAEQQFRRPRADAQRRAARPVKTLRSPGTSRAKDSSADARLATPWARVT